MRRALNVQLPQLYCYLNQFNTALIQKRNLILVIIKFLFRTIKHKVIFNLKFNSYNRLADELDCDCVVVALPFAVTVIGTCWLLRMASRDLENQRSTNTNTKVKPVCTTSSTYLSTRTRLIEKFDERQLREEKLIRTSHQPTQQLSMHVLPTVCVFKQWRLI